MHVQVDTGNDHTVLVSISETAAKLVRLKFNPSGIDKVATIKALAAALISECEAMRDGKGPGAREAAIAITELQGASMFAVASATAHL